MQETIFEQTYTPNWANIPAGFDWVAVDSDGEVWAYEEKPVKLSSMWLSEGDSEYMTLGYIEEQEDWETMLYERPKNVTV